MRKKTDPVNILIAIIAVLVIAATWMLSHRIFQPAAPKDAPPPVVRVK